MALGSTRCHCLNDGLEAGSDTECSMGQTPNCTNSLWFGGQATFLETVGKRSQSIGCMSRALFSSDSWAKGRPSIVQRPLHPARREPKLAKW